LKPAAVAILLALVLGGCAAEVPLQTPVGTWRGVGLPGHPDTEYIRRFAADQSFRLEYCAGGRLHAERGHWSFGGGALTLDTDVIDADRAKAEDVYQTDSFDGSEWDFTLASSDSDQDDVDNDYSARRVSDAMQFTGCA
jgi:hypothetical protein